jgi:hypothetical protein
MTSVHARRLLATALVTGLATVAAPAAAFADTAFAPDFSKSVFITAGETVGFPAIEARPFNEVGLPKTIGVEFTAPIRTSWTDYSMDPGQAVGTPLGDDSTTDADPPYLQSDNGSKFPATGTVDSSDNSMLDVSPPSGLPDGHYVLHVTAFEASGCPDVNFGEDPSSHSCTTYDGYVVAPDTGQNFGFNIDTTGPSVTIDSSSVPDPITAANIGGVTFTGTTSADTQSLALTIKSSDGKTAPRFVPATVAPPAQGAGTTTWSAPANLSTVGDGTLTISAVGTDYAGNKTDPATTASTQMSAHPSAPQNVSVVPGDGQAALAWAAPSSDGGSPITGYQVTATDVTDDTVAPAQTTFHCSNGTCPLAGTVTGLVDGDSYLLDLAAVSSVGPGAPAEVSATPTAATTLTATLSRKTVTAGRTVTLSGRLTRTQGGHGVNGASITITPVFDNGKLGKVVTVKTDVLGVWSTTLRPQQNALYTVTFAGDHGDHPATAHARLFVRVAMTLVHKVSSGKAHLSGRVTPNKRGKTVYVYKRVGTKNRLLGKVRLSKSSTWSFSFALPKGTTKVFARMKATRGNLGNKTRLVKLTR